MKFHLGSFPEFKDFHADTSWRPFNGNEKSIWAWQLKALPIAILNIGVILFLWVLLSPAEGLLMNISFPLPIIEAIICLIGVLVVHELLHAIVHPGAGFSSRTIIGFWPSRMLLYTTYNGELKRDRYIAILITPSLIICFMPMLVSIATQILNIWMIYITVLNAFLASGDMLAIMTMLKLPRNAIIRNRGSDAYWKIDTGK